MARIRISFIYKASDPFYTGRHYDNTHYEFLIKAMQQNENIQYTPVPISHEYDAGHLKGRCDAVILAGFRDYSIPKIRGLKSLSVPVLARCGDFHDAKRYGMGEENYDKYGIDCVFNFMSESYFYKYYPPHMNYKTVFFGIDHSLYQNLLPFKDRIKDQILNSGATAQVYQNIRRFKHRIPNTIVNLIGTTPATIRGYIACRTCLAYARDVIRNKEVISLRARLLYPRPSPYHFYRLRTDYNRLPYVVYGIGGAYQQVLSRYQGAIAATTHYPTIKYWEIAAANCLTFMEITKKNHGEYLGFKDKENCIVINRDN